jgi:hypothetical protein
LLLSKFRGKQNTETIVILIVSEESRKHKVNAPEIRPPLDRLNDIEKGFPLKIAIVIAPKFSHNHSTRFYSYKLAAS